jgi:hypothetical protein
MSGDATGPTGAPFRRTDHLTAGYSAAGHALRTFLIAAGIGALGLYLARRATAREWLLLPAFFLIANAIEWAFHRGPMHRPMGPRIFYRNHALLHHRAFEHDSMPVGELRELELVMMPWYTMLLLFALASPVAVAAWIWRGAPAAGMFYLTAAGYFVLYESLHALYHFPPPLLRRLHLGGPLFSALMSHHRQHHRLDRMAHVNFNVTVPITDTIMGTREREDGEPLRQRRPAQSA